MTSTYMFGGKKYVLLQTERGGENVCSPCAFFDDDSLCELAGNDCTSIRAGYFMLAEKTKATQSKMTLPTEAAERKCIPITSGVLDYFPLAIAEVAKASYAGNQQHHPNEPLFWDKSKSTDHGDCIARHLIDQGKYDSDGIRHSAKLAWRALALLQIELENELGKK